MFGDGSVRFIKRSITMNVLVGDSVRETAARSSALTLTEPVASGLIVLPGPDGHGPSGKKLGSIGLD